MRITLNWRIYKWNKIKIILAILYLCVSLCYIVTNMLDCDIVESDYEFPFLFSNELNSSPILLHKDGLGIK